jgi:hypothetical protein
VRPRPRLLPQRRALLPEGRKRPPGPGRFATDGDAKTFWQPADTDKQPTLLLDFERSIAVQSVRIAFPSPAAYGFVIEYSADGQKWDSAVEHSAEQKPQRDLEARVPAGAVARCIRVRFIHWTDTAARQRAGGVRDEAELTPSPRGPR